MQVNISEGGTKIQLLYVLWVLENFSDESNTLKQDDIVDILEKKGYHTERKSVARDLKLLLDFGYKIHGIEPEIDEDGNELPMKRGAIWLEREFSDEQISLLLNSVAYNVFVEKNNKEELLNNIISLGSKTFKEKHSPKSLLNGGRIYQVEGATILNQLKVIEKAIENEKRLRFKYASKLKREGNNFVYQKDKEYVVSPYWIVSKNGNLYLVCYNHGANKIWNCRIDKIKEVEVIKSSAIPKTDTELKDISVGDYVSKHPNMFTGSPISIELKVEKDKIGHVCDTFDNVITISETEEFITVKVTCGELDMFYWAIQYGGYVEVLKPQSLREKIRIHIESLAFNYKAKEGDKYSEAIRNAIRTRTLDLSGIDLVGKKEHFGLKRITKVYLSNNNIDNVDFLKEYYSLQELCLENNPVTDLSCLNELKGLKGLTLSNLNLKNIDFVAGKYFSNLVLDLGKETDFSALAKINCKKVKIGGSSYYNYSIPHTELEKSKIECEYFDVEPEAPKVADIKIFRDNYPFNFLDDAFGSWSIIPEKIEETKKEIENVFSKFNAVEKRYLELYYKERIMNIEDIRKILKISQRECDKLRDTINSKIVHPSINGELKKYFMEGALEGKFQNTDIIFSYINLTEALEKKQKTNKISKK